MAATPSAAAVRLGPAVTRTGAAAVRPGVQHAEAIAMFEFPFPVPEDLSTATDDDLHALLAQVRDFAGTFTGATPSADVVTALTACRDLAKDINSALATSAEIRQLSEDLDSATAPAPGDVSGEPQSGDAASTTLDEAEPGDGDPLTAAAKTKNPTVREIAARRSAAGRGPDLPAAVEAASVTMHATADVPGKFSTGQELSNFSDVVAALTHRVDRDPRARGGDMKIIRNGDFSKLPAETLITADDGSSRMAMHSFTRRGGVEFRRNFPRNLRVEEGDRGYSVAQFAASEKRLPGGSLLSSFRKSFEDGRPITAAAGWCAPSEPIYDLCELSSLDGILDLPELQTDRGGWQIPSAGGPNFATVWSGIGNSGDTHLTEAQVIEESPSKYCYDIPCPEYEDKRLGVDYVCLTGSLLQRRGFPEVVQWFSKQAMIALPHKINQGVIAAIVAASGAATVIAADPAGDDAISGLLSAVDLAITDAKYRNRMAFNGTLEIVLPMWVLVQLRASATRRAGVDMTDLEDAKIVKWFADRKAVPRFVYDWQDAFSGLLTGPGGATPLTALPTTVQFLVYPAGTWVKAVQSVVSLDTIYDSTKLTTNEYTAIFAEDGWAALQMCPLSRLYTAPVDPSGCLCSVSS